MAKHKLTIEDADAKIFGHEFAHRISGSFGKGESKSIDAVMALSKTNDEPLDITNEVTRAFYRVTVGGEVKIETEYFALALAEYNKH